MLQNATISRLSFGRSLVWFVLPALLLSTAALAYADGRALSYTLGPQQDSYIIEGAGFAPSTLVNIVEMPCPELPCAAEGMASTRDVRVSADGTFSALLVTNPQNDTWDKRDYRLIVAVEPPELAGAAENAFVEVPRHHPGTNSAPGAPGVGTGAAQEQRPVNTVLAAGLIVMAAGAGGFALARVRASRA
jgi:hypothetical protein